MLPMFVLELSNDGKMMFHTIKRDHVDVCAGHLELQLVLQKDA